MPPSNPRPSDLFPERLRTARQRRGLSQEDLAKRTKTLQPSAISHFETGTRKPSFDNLRRLADALDVTTDYLLGRVDDMQDVGDAERVHRHLEQLSTDDREIADKILEMLARRRAGKK
jgi:transcriptional regulator with XRE-family HTH domain